MCKSLKRKCLCSLSIPIALIVILVILTASLDSCVATNCYNAFKFHYKNSNYFASYLVKPQWEKAINVADSAFATEDMKDRSFRKLILPDDDRESIQVEYIPVIDSNYNISGQGIIYTISLKNNKITKTVKFP
ncbi:exported hypothetical protein [Candidatus Zixiibacteriota bacterium]|nr:exported hypothetical protein [candidate division Zixibacteria bacterium]